MKCEPCCRGVRLDAPVILSLDRAQRRKQSLMGQGLLTCPIQLSGQWRPAVMPRARSGTGAIYALCTDGFVPRHDNHFVIATERSVGSNLRWMLMGQGLLACPIQLSGQWRPAVTSRARSLTECPAGMRPARSFGYFVIATE